MNKLATIALVILGALVLTVLLVAGWGASVYNGLVNADEGVKSAWSQVENQYQRRYDLIPNLVEAVRGYAKQEREVLENVTNARARVGQMTMTPEAIKDPASFEQFQAAQDNLGSALSRLLVVVENYPILKSNENFLVLQSQLEGTENRIAVERRRYNEVVQGYNAMTRRFPGTIVAGMAGFQQAVYFKSVAGSQEAPEVRF